jgi:hypothetical protein
MYRDTKILLSLIFAFVLVTGSIPLNSISQAFAQSSKEGYGYDNKDKLPDYIKEYELPKGFNQPTQDTPWPDEIIPKNFALRDACLSGKEIPKQYLSKFNIEAIQLKIVYNAMGFHDPNGRIYVLSEDKNTILQNVAQNPNKNVPEVQPLTIRTNIGKCVEINFKNDLKREYASIHPTGIGLDPNKSDGTFVGFNEDTSVPPGQNIKYRWFPEVEGAHFFTDASRQVVESDISLLGDWASEELESLRQHGLFGALIVEPQGATWTDPYTGKPLKSGVKADIHYPDKIRKDTREFVIFYHDEAGLIDRFGDEPLAPNGEISSFYTINYRGDSVDSRTNPKFLPFNCNPGVDPAVCRDTDFFYNSWVHGDPGGGDLIFPAYSGDPTRFILIGAQTEESHVHHLHQHRWKADSSFGGSPTIDTQTVSAGNEYLTPVNLGFGDMTVNPDTTYAQALVAGAAGYRTGPTYDTIPGGNDADNKKYDDYGYEKTASGGVYADYQTGGSSSSYGGNDYGYPPGGAGKDDTFGGEEHFTGDVLLHCHLFPHYGSGMWSIFRVLDRINSPHGQIVTNGAIDGSGGNAIKPVGPILLPLPDSEDNIQEADEFQPGFPYFIETNDDGSPKLPPNPNGDANGRDYTDLEWKSTHYYQRAIQNGEDPNDRSVAKPGAPYDDPCPPDAKERHYNIAVINDDIVYNKFGHHDPYGRLFVLAEEADDIINGKKEPEPLIMRAEMGDCITMTLENKLTKEGPGFDETTGQTNTRISMHTHFVGFDVLGSDGVVVGYDYMQGVKAPVVADNPDEENALGEKINYRWFAGEQGNIFWHDHINGIEQGFHGTGAMLVVEPPNSVWLDPTTGQELEFGTETEIMVVPEKGYEKKFTPYREFAMLYGDFQELFDKDGNPIMMQAPNFETGGPDLNVGAHPQSSFHDHGVMSINYRNEPLWERMKTALANPNLSDEAKDPANIFHSGFHGDPSTHIYKAYSKDPIKIRMLASSHEELHNFVLNGLHPTGMDGFVPPYLGLQAQTIGTAEQFTFDFTAPVAVSARNDYMYSSFSTNDIFAGMWGLTRVWCDQQSLAEDPLFGTSSPSPVKLAPLPGIKPAECRPASDVTTTSSTAAEEIPVVSNNNNGDNNIQDTNNNDNNYGNDQLTQDNILPFSPGLDATSIQEKENDNDDDSNSFEVLDTIQRTFLPDAEAQEEPPAGESNGRIILIPPEQDPQIPFEDQPPANQRRLAPPSLQPPPTSLVSPTPATGIGPQSVNELGISPTSCDPDAKKIAYKIVALQKDIVLNKFEDKIPDGIFFVLEEDVPAIQSGEKPIEPLVLRANVGDCVVLELKNNLDNTPIAAHDHPLQPGECNEHVVVACLDPDNWPTSKRVSLHPDNLFYDVGAFDGTNMGFNPVDQTIGPGETIRYEWQTVKTGTNVLTDMGDLRGHRHHGGYGMLIVEPEGAKYLDVNTQEPIKSGPSADIVFPDSKKNFREFALTLGTSHYIITKEDPDLCIIGTEEEPHPPGEPPEPEPAGEPPGCNQEPVNDPEDQGFPAINYRSEPFVHRLIEASQQGPPTNLADVGVETSKRLSQLQSSLFHGDPATPILRVPEGKPTVLRVADVGDSVRGYSFHVAGHLMLRPAPISLDDSDIPYDAPFKPFIERGTADQTTPGRSYSLQLVGGAGGLQDIAGDYLYQDQKLARMVEGGAWGILRVQPADFDPIKAAQYLFNEISSSTKIPNDIKPELVMEIQKILKALQSTDQTAIENICKDIIPKLLIQISEYEDNLKDTNIQNININNNNGYGNNDYSENKDEDYVDQKDSYGNEYYKNTLTLEKLEKLLRNIAYSIC